MFQFPGFAFYPYVFRIKYPLVDNQKSETIPAPRGTNMISKFQLSKVGFPIRKSAGQRLFAPHHSLSQRTTSFIASYRQGIHQMPLSRLIALISNAHLMFSFSHIPILAYRDLRDPEPRLADTALKRPEVIRNKPRRRRGCNRRSPLDIPSAAGQLALPNEDGCLRQTTGISLSQPLAYLLFTMSNNPPVRVRRAETGTLLHGTWSWLDPCGEPDTAAPTTSAPDTRRPDRWWSQTGSNRRPHACKARALPAELWPLSVSLVPEAARPAVRVHLPADPRANP